MKNLKLITVLLVFALIFSSLLTPVTNAQALESKNEAIANSTYYSVKNHEIVLNEIEALSSNPNLEMKDFKEVKKFLKSLTDEDIDQILVANGYSLEEVKIDLDLAHANIVWFVPVIIIAILVTGALIFTALYFNHTEKQNLINKCYANKGYPVIDSRDSSGVNGTTNSGAAKAANGYKFECRKR
ncbi:MAG: chromosome partitioning protein ParB [Bacillota bacterium]